MARIGASTKIHVLKESTFGTYNTPTKYYRALTESLLPKYDFVQDDTLIGNAVAPTQWVAGENCEGALDGPLFPDQMGYNIHSVLGAEAAVSNPVLTYILVAYNGTKLYARLTKSTTNLTAEVCDDGSTWIADTNFNTTGTIDVSAAAFDTIAELQAAITAYTGWDAVYFGAGGVASSKIADFAATNVMANDVVQGGLLMKAIDSTSTTTKTHNLTPAAAGGELPSYSFNIDRGVGTNKAFTFIGMTAKTLAIANNAKDVIKSTWTLTGTREQVDQNDVTVTVPTTVPMLSANIKIAFQDSTGAVTEFTEIKNISITIDPAIDDNRNLGSLYPSQPCKQQEKYEFAMSMNATTTQYAFISKYKSNADLGCYIYCTSSTSYADSANSVPYSFMIFIPHIMFTDFSSPASSKDRFVVNAPFKLFKSASTVNSSNIYIYVVDTNLTTY